MSDEHVLIMGGDYQEVWRYARMHAVELGIEDPRQALAVTHPLHLSGRVGGQLIVLDGYTRLPRHAELLVEARRRGMEVVHRWGDR